MRRTKLSTILKELDEVSKLLTGRDIPSWTKQAFEELRHVRVQAAAPATEDPYAVLGLDPNCIPADVVSRYRKLAQKYHPDNRETGDAEKFKKITAAYEAICLARGIR